MFFYKDVNPKKVSKLKNLAVNLPIAINYANAVAVLIKKINSLNSSQSSSSSSSDDEICENNQDSDDQALW